MKRYFTTSIGRLRLLGFLEGGSLLLLLFVAVPMKYLLHDPGWVKLLGPVHGALFTLFVINTFSVAVERSWRFSSQTWKILLACLIPFGTYYIDRAFLRHEQ